MLFRGRPVMVHDTHTSLEEEEECSLYNTGASLFCNLLPVWHAFTQFVKKTSVPDCVIFCNDHV